MKKILLISLIILPLITVMFVSFHLRASYAQFIPDPGGDGTTGGGVGDPNDPDNVECPLVDEVERAFSWDRCPGLTHNNACRCPNDTEGTSSRAVETCNEPNNTPCEWDCYPAYEPNADATECVLKCGNGQETLDPGEQCEDGGRCDDPPGQACITATNYTTSSPCTSGICRARGGDGCSATCQSETEQ